MGVAPSELRALTPAELFAIQECWIEAHGGVSERRRKDARAAFEALRRRYPDRPCAAAAPLRRTGTTPSA